MPEAGWYDDPQGGGGKRWWDGERWSEHTTPPPGSIPPAAATPPAPPGAPAAAGWDPQPAAGGWQAGAAAGQGTPGVQPTPQKGGAGKIVALILGLVVIVGIGVVVAMLLSGSSDDPEVVATDVVRGEDRTVEVPEDGTWEMEVDLPAGPVVIDVRGEDDFDPVVTLYDSSGTEVARNDDRSGDQQSRFGGGFFDSLIETEVAAGRYRVEVRGFGGHGGRAIVSFPTAGG
jgi:hypothetical protein